MVLQCTPLKAVVLATPVIALALLLNAGIASRARADDYAFGYSGYDGAEYLTLQTAGGPVQLPTNGDQGWVSDTASNPGGPGGNTNYLTGTITGYGNLNDYFAFALSGVVGPVTGVSLTITPFQISDDLTYRLGDATAEAAQLNNAASPDAALYDAIGSGTLFGDFALSAGYFASPDTFVLNAAAVSAINADIIQGVSYFALGGTVNTITVPEPSSWALMLTALGGIGLILRRATKTTGFRCRGGFVA